MLLLALMYLRLMQLIVLPFLDVEAKVAEIVSMAVLIQVSLKLSASFRAIFIAIMQYE
jgi:hypothetical protein